MNKKYRKCVGMVVFNSKGMVLVGERVGITNSWQFPQGGIDENEDPLIAAHRELYEEVGIKETKLVMELSEWISYDFPEWIKKDWEAAKKVNLYDGQIQKWFLYYWNGSEEDCKLNIHEKEFESVQFMAIEETINYVIEFKKQVYEKVIEFFQPKIKEYLLQEIQ